MTWPRPHGKCVMGLGYALSDSRPRAGAQVVGWGIRQHRVAQSLNEHISGQGVGHFLFRWPHIGTLLVVQNGRTESKNGPKHKLETSVGKWQLSTLLQGKYQVCGIRYIELTEGRVSNDCCSLIFCSIHFKKCYRKWELEKSTKKTLKSLRLPSPRGRHC